MLRLKENLGIARIVKPNENGAIDQHVGMAFVVGEQHVMTCCHVMNQALGLGSYHSAQPTDSVFEVRFPYVRDGNGREARTQGRVVLWGFERSPRIDVAVLELTTKIPAEVGLATFEFTENSDTPWSCIGYNAEGIVREATGILGTVLPDRTRQLNGPTGIGARIDHGYSGGAVWSSVQQAFVGMVVTKDKAQAENSLSYMIPASVLQSIWPLPQLSQVKDQPSVRENTDLLPIDRVNEIRAFKDGILEYLKTGHAPAVIVIAGWQDQGHKQLVERICFGELNREIDPDKLKFEGALCEDETKSNSLRDGIWPPASIKADILRAIRSKHHCDLEFCIGKLNLKSGRDLLPVCLAVDATDLAEHWSIQHLADACLELSPTIDKRLAIFYCIRFPRPQTSWLSLLGRTSAKSSVKAKFEKWWQETRLPPNVLRIPGLDDLSDVDYSKDVEILLKSYKRPLPRKPPRDKLPYDVAHEMFIK